MLWMVPHIFTTHIDNTGTGVGHGGSRGEAISSSHNMRLIAAIWAAQLMLPCSSLALMNRVLLTHGVLLLSSHQSVLLWFFSLTDPYGSCRPHETHSWACPTLNESQCSWRVSELCSPRKARMTPHAIRQLVTLLSRVDPSRRWWVMFRKIQQSHCLCKPNQTNKQKKEIHFQNKHTHTYVPHLAVNTKIWAKHSTIGTGLKESYLSAAGLSIYCAGILFTDNTVHRTSPSTPVKMGYWFFFFHLKFCPFFLSLMYFAAVCLKSTELHRNEQRRNMCL